MNSEWPSFVKLAWRDFIASRGTHHGYRVHWWDADKGEIYLSHREDAPPSTESVSLIQRHGGWIERRETFVCDAYPIDCHVRAISIIGHGFDPMNRTVPNKGIDQYLIAIQCPSCRSKAAKFQSAFAEFRKGRASANPKKWETRRIHSDKAEIVDVVICQSCGGLAEILCNFNARFALWIQAAEWNVLDHHKTLRSHLAASSPQIPDPIANVIVEFLHPFKGNIDTGHDDSKVTLIDNFLCGGSRLGADDGGGVECHCGYNFDTKSVEPRLDSSGNIKCAVHPTSGQLMGMMGRFSLNVCGDVYLFYNPIVTDDGWLTDVQVEYFFEREWNCINVA